MIFFFGLNILILEISPLLKIFNIIIVKLNSNQDATFHT